MQRRPKSASVGRKDADKRKETPGAGAEGGRAPKQIKGKHEVVKLPTLNKYIRNKDPSKIDELGFVEAAELLPDALIDRILAEATERGGQVEISNALQSDVSKELGKDLAATVKEDKKAKQTMRAVFGKGPKHGKKKSNYYGFTVETPKVLATRPGSLPQIPHGDDHCTSCVVCIVHLRDGQLPTRVAKYDGSNKDYPTVIDVKCEGKCNREFMLPDEDFRRGVHLTDESWTCDDCDAPHDPYDFDEKMTKSFGELLEPGAPDLCDGYAGREAPEKGDGILALPTLIHRGPGNPSSAAESRYVLFFTLRPLYRNMDPKEVVQYHRLSDPRQ